MRHKKLNSRAVLQIKKVLKPKHILDSFLSVMGLVRISKAERKVRRAQDYAEYAFKFLFSSYIEDEILPRAHQVRVIDYSAPVFVKHFKDGKTRTLIHFFLELDCLSRLADKKNSECSIRHFPRIIDFDIHNRSITMTDEGTSLRDLSEIVKVPDAYQQVERIMNQLLNAGIVHYDICPLGKNLVVDSVGKISIIDFGLVEINGVCYTPDAFERRLDCSKLATHESICEALLLNPLIDTESKKAEY